MSKNIKSWSPESWRIFPIKQQPKYQDQQHLKQVEAKLQQFPPLVSMDEIEKLKQDLAQVGKGEAFLLQGGDCAESFAEFDGKNLKNFFKVILQMTIALMHGSKKPVVKIGRVAGQYAKPRSADFEEKDGVCLPSYRGDIINDIAFEQGARNPDPEKLIEAYFHSTATMNYIRALSVGGFSSLKNIKSWNKDFANNLKSQQIEKIINEVADSINLIESCGIKAGNILDLNSAKFFTSHEALLLNYEQAFTRIHRHQHYALSAHMLWIGDRTRHSDEAHVEFLRGVQNPIGVKVGPTTDPADLIKVIHKLNPENEEGKIVLISRMGANKVEQFLPNIVNAIKNSGQNIVWSCDPMHGNTIKSSNNYKTRKFEDILREIELFFAIHHDQGTIAGGVHFEMTGQDVTECLGGGQNISEKKLSQNYNTRCDPRLNASQSLELAFLIADKIKC